MSQTTNKEKEFTCCAGSNIAYNYSLGIDENGDQYLIAEEYDLQQIIDSFADQCSIERIIVSHGLGDELLMNQKPGVFLDEDAVDSIKLATKNTLDINAQILSLYP